MHFLMPVNNLSFKALNTIDMGRASSMDAYVNGYYYAAGDTDGNGKWRAQEPGLPRVPGRAGAGGRRKTR